MLAFTTDDFNKVFRAEVGDSIVDVNGSDEDRLWKDWEVYGYMTEAISRVMSETATTMRLIELPVLQGQREVRCPFYIEEIRLITRKSDNRKVEPYNTNEGGYGVRHDYGLRIDGQDMLLNTEQGQPRGFVRDYMPGFLHLIPVPSENDTLVVQCEVKLSMPLEAGMPLPLAEIEDQRLALEWMKARAYRKHDAETEDLVRANSAETWFKAEVINRAAKLRNNRRKPGVVRMEW